MDADRAGAPAAFVAFFREHHRSLIRVAMYAGATEHEARAAAQEAMVEVLRRWDDITSPPAYARRAVLSQFRKARRDSLDKVRAHQVRHGAGTPEARLDQDLTLWEDEQWVRQLLDSLPAKQRQVMQLVVDGFEPREIAALLGRSPEAVRQNLREARLRLMQALEEDRSSCEAVGATRKES